MRIYVGMRVLVAGERSVLGWKESFSKVIGVTGPKVRTRDKGVIWSFQL